MCGVLGLPGPDARVDPAAFSEAEYPVYCMRCGYELRGLAESRCPECGDPFDRGHLLLEQYVHCKRPRTDRRYRLARRLGHFALVLSLSIAIVPLAYLLSGLLGSEALAEFLRGSLPPLIIARTIWWSWAASMLCVGLHLLLSLTMPPPWAKRRAVREAWQAERRRARARKRTDGTPKR